MCSTLGGAPSVDGDSSGLSAIEIAELGNGNAGGTRVNN